VGLINKYKQEQHEKSKVQIIKITSCGILKGDWYNKR
jgi:hypothetical protein